MKKIVVALYTAYATVKSIPDLVHFYRTRYDGEPVFVQGPTLNNLYEEYYFEKQVCGYQHSYNRFILDDFFEVCKMIVGQKICSKFHHNYVNDGGFANGETGQDHFTCTRCGHSFNHIYY